MLYQAAVNTYQATVLDVMLRKRDGIVVCREIRRRGATVPILVLTARDTVADRVTGLDTGADYLTKPFDFAELLARLRALLRRGPAMVSSVIRIADLELDTRAQRATRAGRHVPLTTKEYALLEFLARHGGRVVGRAEISEHVWDDNYGSDLEPHRGLHQSPAPQARRRGARAADPHPPRGGLHARRASVGAADRRRRRRGLVSPAASS